METPSASSAATATAAAAATPAARGGRGRSATKKRHTLPLARSSSSRPPDNTDLPPTPTAEMAPCSFSYETPSPSSSRSVRGARSRQGDAAAQSPEDPDSKGGRSLRRKPRIDYSFDQVEDSESFAARATPTASRTLKKRKTDISFLDGDADEEHEMRVKRRASEQPLPASTTRRKSAARKSTVEPQMYVPDQQVDDAEVQDTIEVGGRHSHSNGQSDDSFRARTSSSSSHHDLTPKAGPPAAALFGIQQHQLQHQPPSPSPFTAHKQDEISTELISQPVNGGGEKLDHAAEDPPRPPRQPSASPTMEKPDGQPMESNGQQPESTVANGMINGHQSVSTPEPEEVGPRDATPQPQAPLQPSPIKQEVKAAELKNLDIAAAPKKSENDPLGHLTPYIPGAVAMLPKLKSTGDGDPDAEPEAEPDQEAAPEAEPDSNLDEAAHPAEEASEEPGEAADEETPIGTPLALETAANSPAPEPESATSLPSRRQYAFRKTRDASEFTSLFDDVKGLSYVELYYRLQVANRALVAWQNEFNALRQITEDEDNSIRYHQEELAFQHREKMALSKDPSANPLRKDFVVKGTRAPKPDPHLTYLRQQDKVMAQAYLFEYDDRESKIGQQDPISQRTGAAGKARLRDRPKQTAKAAEADDPAVLSGKRARKAPTLFDGLEGASRSSTPAPSSQPKRRRRGADQGADETGEPLPPPVDANGDAVPVKKGKGGRPRKHPLPVPAADDASTPAPENAPTLPTPNIAERPVRKRRRRDLDEEDEALANGTASEASKKAKRRNSRVSEIPTGSFYSQSSTYVDEDARPATSSSTATNTTTASSPNNYSLREKRQKKFSIDDGEYDDIGGGDDDTGSTPQPRAAKRARRGPRKSYVEQVMPLPDDYSMESPQPEPPQALAPKPTPKIKIKNYQPSSAATPAGGAASSPYSPARSQTMDSPTGSFRSNGHTPQTEPEVEKDYSTMTKSEKMSYSMKARWASGSMSAAVSKRRATLAAKKNASAAIGPKPGDAATETSGAQ